MAASAVLALVVMVVTVTAAAVLVLVVMVVTVTTAAALVLVVMVVTVTAAATLVLVVMVVIAAAALALMVMVVTVGVLSLDAGQHLLLQGGVLDGGEDGLSVQLLPGGGEQHRMGVVFFEGCYGLLQLLRGELLGAGENHGAGGANLVEVELPEILQIALDFAGVYHGDIAVECKFGQVCHGSLHSGDDVGQFSHAGGFDENAVGVELGIDVLQGLAEVAHQGAADAAGGHFGDLNPCFLEETAVYADFAKLVFNEHQPLPGIGLCQELFNEGGLTGAEKAGYNINFCHRETSFSGARPQCVV